MIDAARTGKEKRGKGKSIKWRETKRLTNEEEGRRADRISKRRFATSRAAIVKVRERRLDEALALVLRLRRKGKSEISNRIPGGGDDYTASGSLVPVNMHTETARTLKPY